jgi:hypothetical protein
MAGWRGNTCGRRADWQEGSAEPCFLMNWHFFATLYTGINNPVDDFVNVMVGALTDYLTPILRVLITVYVAAMAMVAAINPGQEPLGHFLRQLLRAALVFFVVSSAANFNQYFGTIFLTTLPTEISNAISGAAGTHVVTGGAFDTVWNKAWTAGLVVYKNLPWSIKGVALELLVVVYWFVAITWRWRWSSHWVPCLFAVSCFLHRGASSMAGSGRRLAWC